MVRSDTEPEARMYWMLMRQLKMLSRAGLAFPEDARDTAEELEVLAEFTNNLHLKRLCLAAAAVLAPTATLADIAAITP